MFQNLFVRDRTQIEWDKLKNRKTIIFEHVFWVSQALYQIIKYLKKPRYSICGVDNIPYIFHHFGVAVNSDAWEPENNPSRKTCVTGAPES